MYVTFRCERKLDLVLSLHATSRPQCRQTHRKLPTLSSSGGNWKCSKYLCMAGITPWPLPMSAYDKRGNYQSIQYEKSETPMCGASDKRDPQSTPWDLSSSLTLNSDTQNITLLNGVNRQNVCVACRQK